MCGLVRKADGAEPLAARGAFVWFDQSNARGLVRDEPIVVLRLLVQRSDGAGEVGDEHRELQRVSEGGDGL